MAIQTVNVGTTPNDGTGDPARTAFIKLNDNFTAAENAAAHLLLGTVSQSGGVPTGAIIERGSNANGEFVKYADGTMICTSNVISGGSTAITDAGDSIFFSAACTWTFPATFVSEPRVNFSTEYITSSFGVWSTMISSTTSTAAGVFLSNTSRAASGHNLYAVAIGRWY